jgi:hypothetical protein
MSRHEFDPKCPDCRPTLLDPATGEVLPPDDPAMVTIQRVWDAAPREQQEAFHRVTVKNSRDPKDLALVQEFSKALLRQ